MLPKLFKLWFVVIFSGLPGGGFFGLCICLVHFKVIDIDFCCCFFELILKHVC